MNRTLRTACLTALLAITGAASAQQEVQQKQLSVDQVIGPDAKPDKSEIADAKERERHNREMEKQLKKIAKENRFAMGAGARLQTKTTQQLPPNSTSY